MDTDPAGQGDEPIDVNDVRHRVPAPRKEGITHDVPPATSDDAVWDEFFTRYKERIARVEKIQDQDLKSVRRRKSIVFSIYMTTAVLAILSAASTAVLASLSIILDQHHLVPNIASGGGFAVSGSLALVFGFMRRQIRDEEREIKKAGEDLRSIEGSMFAARVAPDSFAKCEMLAELVASFNALLARQENR